MIAILVSNDMQSGCCAIGMSAMVQKCVGVGAVHVCKRNGGGGRHFRDGVNVPSLGYCPKGGHENHGISYLVP
jgi:hypothetical protein